MGRLLYHDLHEGKGGLAVLSLLDQLSAHGQSETVTLVLQHLATRSCERTDWHFLDLMRTYNMAGLLQEQVRQAEAQRAVSVRQFPARQEVLERLALFLASLLTTMQERNRI